MFIVQDYVHFEFSFVFQLYYQCLNFAMIVSSALMIWKGLMVFTGSESPIVVVLRYDNKDTGSASRS